MSLVEEEPSTVTVRFKHAGEASHAHFAPLLPLRTVEADCQQMRASSLRCSDVSAQVSLHQGTFKFPLGKSKKTQPLTLTVRQPQAINATIVVSDSVIECINISAEKGIIIRDILWTLLAFQELFVESKLLRVFRFLRMIFGFMSVFWVWLWNCTESLFQISLHQVLIYRRTNGKALRYQFSGICYIKGKVPIMPFRVQLPAWILPHASAHLDKLCSPQPFENQPFGSAIPNPEDFVAPLCGLVRGFSANVDAQAQLPWMRLELCPPDETIWSVDTKLCTDEVYLRCVLTGTVTDSSISLNVNEYSINTDESFIEDKSVGDSEISDCKFAGVAKLLVECAPGMLVETLTTALRYKELPKNTSYQASTTVHDKSRLKMRMAVNSYNPKLKCKVDIPMDVNLTLGGSLSWLGELRPQTMKRQLLSFPDAKFSTSADVVIIGGEISDGSTTFTPESVVLSATGYLECDREHGVGNCMPTFTGSFNVRSETIIDECPEIGIHAGDVIKGEYVGKFNGNSWCVLENDGKVGEKSWLASLDKSNVKADLETLSFTLNQRSLVFPPHMLTCVTDECAIRVCGMGRSTLTIFWDMLGKSPKLHDAVKDKSVDVFVEKLHRGSLRICVGETGGLKIVGGNEGHIYNWRFFQALLNPVEGKDHLRHVLECKETREIIIQITDLLHDDLGSLSRNAREIMAHVFEVFDQGKLLDNPENVIPKKNLIKLLVKIIKTDSQEIETLLEEILTDVIAAKGLDLTNVRKVLNTLVPEWMDHRFYAEINSLLKMMKLMLEPATPHVRVEKHFADTLPCQQEYRAWLQNVPTPDYIYELLRESKANDRVLSSRVAGIVARLVPYMTLRHLEYFRKFRSSFPEEQMMRIDYAWSIKERSRRIAEEYGGLMFLPQSIAIQFFLGDALQFTTEFSEREDTLSERCDSFVHHYQSRRRICDGQTLVAPSTTDMMHRNIYDSLGASVMGPADVAILLQSGLSAPVQHLAVQHNQRMLLELCFSQPPLFLIGTLVELSGNQSQLMLNNSLIQLLNMQQNCLTQPLDVAEMLSEKLGIPIPRFEDFKAGGSKTRDSYYEAINETSGRILQLSEPYRALKTHLQLQHHMKSTWNDTIDIEIRARREGAAKTAIDAADKAGAAWMEDKSDKNREAAEQKYLHAFKKCRELIREDAKAFQSKWLKVFMKRNYEALMVLNVFENVRDNVDNCRKWLSVQADIPEADILAALDCMNETDLVDWIIAALYFEEDDRKTLSVDPLVRLLLPEPEGFFDFTVVSAMGVITDGSVGRELQDSWERVMEKRGVRMIRANTGIARSLEFNAEKIYEAIVKIQSKEWGYIGYSQGCANALKVEAMLRGGTPTMQNMLKGLKTRNLLFSAANGSAHGAGIDEKVLKAVIQGEKASKNLQVQLSNKCCNAVLTGVLSACSQRELVQLFGGAQTFTDTGVTDLWRDAQHKDAVPTFTMRGCIESDVNLPECLEFLANTLTIQGKDPYHDTQVSAYDSVGYPRYVKNLNAVLMENNDVGGMIQRTHHWSPLIHETTMLCTARDVKRAVFDTPKDRHIFPWLECSARFGIISRTSDPKTDHWPAPMQLTQEDLDENSSTVRMTPPASPLTRRRKRDEFARSDTNRSF